MTTLNHNPFAFDATPSTQEVFDRAVEFFSNPKARRCTDGTGCSYTLRNGTHCVVGYMLDNATLDWLNDLAAAIDNIARWDVIGHSTIQQGINFKGDGTQIPQWVKDHMSLLVRLQYVHDNRAHWNATDAIGLRNDALKVIAENFDLKFTEIVFHAA